MNRQIDQAGEFLRPLVALEGDEAAREFDALLGETPQPDAPHVLKFFVAKRRESVQSQLAGLSEGERLEFGGMPSGLLKLLIAIGIALVIAGLLNVAAYLWGVIVGFRASKTWGLLNMFLYPISPVVYGFRSHKDLGRRAAIMTVCSFGTLIVVLITAAGMLS